MARTYPILERAPERPHKCVVSGINKNLVDLQTFIPDYGRVYLSVNIIAAIAAEHGFLSPGESAQIKEAANEVAAENRRLKALLKEFTDGVHRAADLLLDRAGVPAGGDAVADAADEVAGAGAEEADAAAGIEDPAGVRDASGSNGGDGAPAIHSS